MTQVTLLCLAALAMDLGLVGLFFAVGRRAAEQGASPFALGLLGGITFASYTLITLLGGSLSDRFGRRRLAVSGAALGALATLACALTSSIPLLVALMTVLGLGIGLFWPAVIGWLGEDCQGQALARRLAWFSLSWNTGAVLGFGLTGVLFRAWPGLAFAASIAVVGLAGLLVAVPPRRPAPPPSIPAGDPGLPAVPPGRGFRKTAWLAHFAVNFAGFGVIAVFPLLATQIGIPADAHGGLFALSRVAALVAFWLSQHLLFWRTRLWPLWVAQLVSAAAFASFAMTSQWIVFAAALVVSGLVSGYSYQASIYFTLEEMTEKGKGGGIHEAVIGSSAFLGPICAGLVGSWFAGRSAYVFCAASLVVFVLIQVAVVAVRRRGQRLSQNRIRANAPERSSC